MLTRIALLVATAATISAPTTTRFRIEQKTESKVDLSGFGQGEQTQNQSAVWFVSITYTDSAGGRVVHVVVDSLRVDGGMMPIPQASIDSARSTTFHGFLDGDWRLKSLSASQSSLLASQFESTLKMLHPSVRRGAPAGTRWSDTLDVSTRNTQADLTSNTVRNFVMGGAEAFEGTPATRVNVETLTSIKGTLETPGGTADMAGAGPGTGTYYLMSDGRLVGGSSTSQVEALVTIAGAPAPIPVKTTSTTTVSVLK